MRKNPKRPAGELTLPEFCALYDCLRVARRRLEEQDARRYPAAKEAADHLGRALTVLLEDAMMAAGG